MIISSTTTAFVVFGLQINQIKTEICMNGDFCAPPKLCCQSSASRCCSWRGDDEDEHNPNYPYGAYYKLKLWDTWYFWLLVVLVVMSCSGGCGYWWKKQFIMYSRSSAFYSGTHQQPSCSYHHHRAHSSRTSNSTETSTGDEESWSTANSPYRQPQLLPSSLYNSSTQYFPSQRSINVIMQPPPLYSEVTAKPDLYPVIEESSREAAKTPTSFDNDLIISRFMASGVVCAASPSSSTNSTTQGSSVFLPPPYSESDVSAPYTSSYPASNISTPGSVLSYSTNSDVIFLNNSFPTSTVPTRPPCLSPPLATSPTQVPCSSNNDNTSPTSSLNLALSRLEQNVSAIIRHSERHSTLDSDDNRQLASGSNQVPSTSTALSHEDAFASPTVEPPMRRSCNAILSSRRSSLGSNQSESEGASAVARSHSLKYGRRGILIKAKSDDHEDANERTVLIKPLD